MRPLTMMCAAAIAAIPAVTIAQSMSAPTYLKKAGASDLFERQSGTVMKASTNAGVRNFATMMVRDHTQSTADVKAAAQSAKLTVAPPKLDAEQSRNLAALKSAKGTARDRLYIDQQKTAHQQALTVQQGYADTGTVAPLKSAAAKIVPVVQSHIKMLDAM